MISSGEAILSLGNGSNEMSNFCMELSHVKMKDQGSFVDTKLMTRLTYTFDQMMGDVSIDGSKFSFKAKDEIAVTRRLTYAARRTPASSTRGRRARRTCCCTSCTRS